MDEGSPTITLTTRTRKRSISSHRHPNIDNGTRTLIKTKIQKIDGQYKASPTCPINNEQERANSSDDPDEPLIVATVPPLVQDGSKYRIRQDIYDDETGDDQQSNTSSNDSSPVHRSESPIKSTIITIQKPIQSLNDNENESTNETSVHIPTMSTRRSPHSLSEENNQEESQQQRTKTPTKKSNLNKSSVSNSSMTISIEQNQPNNSSNQSPLPNETSSTTEETLQKSTSSTDIHLSNNKQSQNTTDPSKVKVRLKPIPPSPQAKKNNKPVTTTQNPKPVEQKPIKKSVATPKETVITTKKTTTTTTTVVTPKKPVKTPIAKPLSTTTNSEKQPVRLASTSSKSIEKKSSDTPNSTGTTKTSTDTPSVKPPPVTLGKIPRLNPANKQKPLEKPTLSKSLTDQKLDLLSTSGGLTASKESNSSEKNLLKRPSPPRVNRPPPENSDPAISSSPMDLVDSTENSSTKPPSSRYSLLLDSNPRVTNNFSRVNSIGLENTQSQSPLSPGPLSTLYPPPSPPTLPQPPSSSRPIPPSTKSFVDSRNNQLQHPPLTNESSQPFIRKNFPTPPVLPRPTSSSSLINAQSIPPLLLMASDYQDPRTAKKSTNIWDSASSDEELEDNSSARRFFHQNMRAVDEELSKIDDSRSMTPPLPADSRTEQLLKRQKKASLCLGSNGGIYEGHSIEASASVDDFECVEMDIDSPKHRTQSESSDHNHTIVDSNNSKNTINGPADSKNAKSTTASSIDTSKKLPFNSRPLKTASMTLIDELKNSINPSSASKQPVLSPPSRSLSRSRSRTRSRSRSHTRSKSRSRSRTRSRSRSRSRSSSSSSSSSSHKRHSRSRRRSSKRHSNKHYQRRRSNSYDNNNERTENSSNTNNYPPVPPHYPPHHHHPPPPPHHQQQQQHWASGRQPGGLMPGPPPPPPQPYGHQQPVPPLLPNHPYYPPGNRSLMHPVDAGNAGGRFNFQHSIHQRHHPPLMHPPYYPPALPQPLMQTASRSHHHPINRYPPPPRPFDLPPHPMGMPNPGPYPPNPNYNQFKYESDEHQAMRRAKLGTNSNNNRRVGSQQTEPNGTRKIPNQPKSHSKPPDHPEMDQLVLEREKLLAKLNEISSSGEIDEGRSGHEKRSASTKVTNSQDDEGEEGEISESD